MDIATGQAESHETPLPYNPAASPAVAGMTQTAGQQTPADQVGVRDLTGERLGQLAGYQSDIAGAQHAGQAAENGRRQHYAQDILPVGTTYGDEMNLPDVPANVVPAAASYAYPWNGTEPVPAAADVPDYPAQ